VIQPDDQVGLLEEPLGPLEMYPLRDPAPSSDDAVEQLGAFLRRSLGSDATTHPSDVIQVKDPKTGPLGRPVREARLATAWSTSDVDATKQPALDLYRPAILSAVEAAATAAP
jgi:hypothetical protein